MVFLCLFSSSTIAQTSINVKDCQIRQDGMGAQSAFVGGTFVQLMCHNDYCMKELMRVEAEGIVRFGYNAMTMQVSHYGYGRYGELAAKLGYARDFGGKLGVGLNFYYLCNHVANYEAVHSVCFDLSLYALVTKRFSFGFEVFNPARLKYGVTGKEAIPMDFRLNMLFQYDEKLLFSLKANLKLPGDFNLKLAAYYTPLSYFGLSFDVSIKSVGIGFLFQYRSLVFQIGAMYNYKLGFSPAVSIVFQFQKKEK